MLACMPERALPAGFPTLSSNTSLPIKSASTTTSVTTTANKTFITTTITSVPECAQGDVTEYLFRPNRHHVRSYLRAGWLKRASQLAGSLPLPKMSSCENEKESGRWSTATQSQLDAPDTTMSDMQTDKVMTTAATTTTSHEDAGHHGNALGIQLPSSGLVFQSTTREPSPDNHNVMIETTNKLSVPAPAPINTSSTPATSHSDSHEAYSGHRTPISAGLTVQTNLYGNASKSSKSADTIAMPNLLDQTPQPLKRTPSVREVMASIHRSSAPDSTPDSALSSPMLSAMSNITPLPSPANTGDSPGPWKKLPSRPTSREFVLPGGIDAALVTTNGESLNSAIMSISKRKAYNGLKMGPESGLAELQKDAMGHERNRSISEYVPEALQSHKPRPQTVSGSYKGLNEAMSGSTSPENVMRREPNLAVKRGLAAVVRPPTPPSSRQGESDDSDTSLLNAALPVARTRRPRYEYYDANMASDKKTRRWRALKLLGEGTFSKVMLATSQMPDESDESDQPLNASDVSTASKMDRKKLVAIKICEHGPKGGASEERVEMSLKRELEIMQSINHPALVHLKAWSIEQTRAILVLSYCPGGDLFDLASQNQKLLVPALLRRIFAELVTAVRYLHERHIVHRDIKLENVLVNLPPQELAKDTDWVTYPYSVITLTDLGLSRRVADDEKLTTRCGSDDYAAPEVIMGSPYDGHAVDAWSLGVLLYALLESRLPFDPASGASEGFKQRSKTSHRIARVEWCWHEYAGDDGDHEADVAKFEACQMRGAMEATEGLLKRARSRWTMDRVAAEPWVRDAIQVPGGLRFREEEVPEEVLPASVL